MGVRWDPSEPLQALQEQGVEYGHGGLPRCARAGRVMAWKDPRPSFQWHQPHPGTGRETRAYKAVGEATLTPKLYCDERAHRTVKPWVWSQPQTPKNNECLCTSTFHTSHEFPLWAHWPWSRLGKGILGSTVPSLVREWSQWALSPLGRPGCRSTQSFPEQTLHPPGEISYYVANWSREGWTSCNSWGKGISFLTLNFSRYT